ncbi:MAG: hypothetical protein V4574_17470 [Pseudomonadota bacterium]
MANGQIPRLPGLKIIHHLHKLRLGQTNQFGMMRIGDSLSTLTWATGALQFERVIATWMPSEPIYCYSADDILGYGLPSANSAHTLGPVTGKYTGTSIDKTDFDIAPDGSCMLLAPGQYCVFGHGGQTMYGDYLVAPIVTEPGASNSVKIEYGTSQSPIVASGWSSPTAGEIDSAHTLTGSDLIVNANAAFGLTVPKLKFSDITWRSIKITNTAASSNVRLLFPQTQVRTAASIPIYSWATATNDFSNATTTSVPIMAAMIAAIDPVVIFVGSDDRLAAYQNFLPKLEAAITASGLANPPAVILEGNPYYQNGVYTDADIRTRTDYCWDFCSTRVNWDVMDMMSVTGGMAEAIRAGLDGDGIHYNGLIAEIGCDAFAQARGYYPPDARRPAGDADLRAVLESASNRLLNARQIPAALAAPQRQETASMTWTLTGGSGIGASKAMPLTTGPVPGATALAYVDEATSPIGRSNGGRPLGDTGSVSFHLRQTVASPNGRFYFVWTIDRALAAAYTGPLVGNGFGFVVENDQLFGICYLSGAQVKSPLSYTNILNRWAELQINITPWNASTNRIEWIVSGEDAGATVILKSLGSSLYTKGGNAGTMRFEATNGGDAVNYSVTVTPPVIVSVRAG